MNRIKGTKSNNNTYLPHRDQMLPSPPRDLIAYISLNNVPLQIIWHIHNRIKAVLTVNKKIANMWPIDGWLINTGETNNCFDSEDFCRSLLIFLCCFLCYLCWLQQNCLGIQCVLFQLWGGWRTAWMSSCSPTSQSKRPCFALLSCKECTW